jgi:hypothetical protein
MQSIERYRRLDQSSQATILWKHGTCLELIRKEEGLVIELYALFNFYAEVVYDQNSGEPVFLRCFHDPAGLDPYLEVLDIEELLTGSHKK